MSETANGVLQLLVQIPPVCDNNGCIKHGDIIGIVKVDDLMGEPRDCI